MQPFYRIFVDNVVQGGARISWEIDRHFIDPAPYEFQLQTGHTGLSESDDWLDVGASVFDTYFVFDLDKRVFGKTLDTHYRIKLITSVDTYYSRSVSSDGLLAKRDWLNAREIIRKEQLRHRVLTSLKGFLLKARRYGPRCIDCTDPYTEEVTKSMCDTCYGTGFELGYFNPLPAYFCDIGLEKNREHRNPQIGMEKQDVIQARFIGDPQLYSYDVWVNEFSDERYYLHTVGAIANVRGIPIIFDAELRLAPFSDVIYTFPIVKDSVPDPPGDKTEETKKEKSWDKRNQSQKMLHSSSEVKKREPTYLEAMLKEIRQKRK